MPQADEGRGVLTGVAFAHERLAPDMPNPPMPYKAAIDVTGGNATMTQPPAEVVIPRVRSLDERLYDELLFDYESVRENW